MDEQPTSVGATPSSEETGAEPNLTSQPIEAMIDHFWEAGPELESVLVDIAPPDTPLELLEQLGPSPFERGGFPLIGFLATTYDKVSRHALERVRPP